MYTDRSIKLRKFSLFLSRTDELAIVFSPGKKQLDDSVENPGLPIPHKN